MRSEDGTTDPMTMGVPRGNAGAWHVQMLGGGGGGGYVVWKIRGIIDLGICQLFLGVS